MEYFCNFLQWWTNKNFSVDPVCTVECTYKLISCVVGESQYEKCTEESPTVYSNFDIFVMKLENFVSVMFNIYVLRKCVFPGISQFLFKSKLFWTIIHLFPTISFSGFVKSSRIKLNYCVVYRYTQFIRKYTVISYTVVLSSSTTVQIYVNLWET
jgi:hypothetical protein